MAHQQLDMRTVMGSCKLYDTGRWRRVKRMQLRMHPTCQECEKQGLTTAAEVVHHVVKHGGDRTKFFTSPLMSLCARCHDWTMQQRERFGFSKTIGLDGYPTDRRHPAWKT